MTTLIKPVQYDSGNRDRLSRLLDSGFDTVSSSADRYEDPSSHCQILPRMDGMR